MEHRNVVSNVPPLVVIVGPTASGKSALAMELAKRFGGEIIAADSRTIYRGMDIGTAKPSSDDQRRIPHHLLNVTTPDQPITAADFKILATEAIADASSRGKLPFLVGGSGLYIDSVVYDFHFRSKPEEGVREEFQSLSIEELQRRLRQKDISLPQNNCNPRHLIRALETNGQIPSRGQPRSNVLVLGLSVDSQTLRERIVQRVEVMVREGFIEEIRQLVAMYGWEVPALQTPGYKAFRPYLEGIISLEAAKQAFIHNDMQYAKRQRTWFKRNNSIHWLTDRYKVTRSEVFITTLLNK